MLLFLKKFLLLILGFVIILAFQSCGSTDSNPSDLESFSYSSPEIYFRSTKNIHVQVSYEPGAEPYTGSSGSGFEYWRVLDENLMAIFEHRSAPPARNITKELQQMTALPAQEKSDWKREDILNLHFSQSPPTSTAVDSYFHVYFLKGYYHDGTQRKTGTIGVQLGGTSVIAIFKEVIQNSGLLPNGPVAKFVEQSTLVHEMGHALGFVNNGVPMKSPHQDSDHGSHTTNEDCVMFWLNEGMDGISDFVQDYISSGNTIMWGPEVIADAKNFSQ